MKGKFTKSFLTVVVLIAAAARFEAATAGAPSSSFGTAGQTVFSVLPSGRTLFPGAFTIQKDGRLIVVGGTSDRTFGFLRTSTEGVFETEQSIVFPGVTFARASAVAIAPDGKILIGGSLQTGTLTDFGLIRLFPSGALDTSFGTNGRATIANPSGGNELHRLTLQPDGKIILIGGCIASTDIPQPCLIRLNANGTLDTGFGGAGNGRIIETSSGLYKEAALQPNGRIVVTGFTFNGLTRPIVKRFNANGTVDTTFNGGLIAADLGDGAAGFSVAVQRDGKILVGGDKAANGLVTPYVARLNANGTFDTSFDGDGKKFFSVPGVTSAFFGGLEIDPNDRILAGFSNRDSAPPGVGVARFNTTGQLDTSFGAGGFAFTEPTDGPARELILDIRIYGGDRVFIANATQNGPLGLHALNLTATPVVGSDFDGDGLTDTAVFRPTTGEWFILQSTTNAVVTLQFGTSGDLPLDGDFDGDGKSDAAVFRAGSGEWLFLKSSDGTTGAAQLGTSADLPAPADFDRDGRTDPTVFQPALNRWVFLRSSQNYANFSIIAFGQNGDVPILSERK